MRKKYGEGLEQLMVQSIQNHQWNMVEQWWHEHGFQWHWVYWWRDWVYWCLLMTWQRTEAARWILKCIGTYSLPRFSQMLQSWFWQCFIVQMDNEPKHSKSNPGVFEGKKKWIYIVNGKLYFFRAWSICHKRCSIYHRLSKCVCVSPH